MPTMTVKCDACQASFVFSPQALPLPSSYVTLSRNYAHLLFLAI